MAHQLDIDTKTGKASMFYFGGAPWHGLGTEVKNAATAQEAIKAANLEWNVKKAPLYADIKGKRKTLLPDYYATIREDTKKILGIVGKSYTPLQNTEAFKFFDPIVGDKAAIYHTAGALDGGKRIWILAKLPDTIQVVGDDITEKYLLLSNDHSGEGSVQLKFTPVRVVCQNTLTQALSSGLSVKVAHFKNMKNKFNDATRLLGIINQNYNDIATVFKQMAETKMDGKKYIEYFNQVFPYPEKHGIDEELFIKKMQRIDEDRLFVEHFAVNGEGNKEANVKHTLWAAYNGVTEYVDHCGKRNNKNKDTPLEDTRTDSKLNSMWFAEGYYIKTRAYDIAVDLMKVSKN